MVDSGTYNALESYCGSNAGRLQRETEELIDKVGLEAAEAQIMTQMNQLYLQLRIVHVNRAAIDFIESDT